MSCSWSRAMTPTHVEQALRLPPHGRFVRNPAYHDGQSTSLAAAFHAIADDSEASVVLMADQPGIAGRRCAMP